MTTTCYCTKCGAQVAETDLSDERACSTCNPIVGQNMSEDTLNEDARSESVAEKQHSRYSMKTMLPARGYLHIVDKAKKINLIRKLMILPVLMGVLFSAGSFGFCFGSGGGALFATFMALGVVFFIGGLIAKSVFSAKIRNYAIAIDEYYYNDYSPKGSTSVVGFARANFSLALCGSTKLVCWLDVSENILKFISNDFRGIRNCKLFSQFQQFINLDFGCLLIPLDTIDSYMAQNNSQSVCLTVADGSAVRKLYFDRDALYYFEKIVPTLEYHFKVSKK